MFYKWRINKNYKSKKRNLNQNGSIPGTILDDKLLISCKQDGVRPTIIQRAGKKPLNYQKF